MILFVALLQCSTCRAWHLLGTKLYEYQCTLPEKVSPGPKNGPGPKKVSPVAVM